MTNKTFKILVILSFFCYFSYSQQSKFNKTEWNIEADLKTYPNREKMLLDLTENNKLKGLTYKQLVEKVGEPENDNNEPYIISYNIKSEYGNDIDPIYVKTLDFDINNDSLINNYTIKEHKH